MPSLATDSSFVSIVLPCFNEKNYITPCLDSIIANEYPKDKLEVLVCDGMSDDGTRDIILSYAEKYEFIKLIDNVRRIIPCALNQGIKNAKGDIIVRMDVHALYAKDYIRKSVNRLLEYNAINVGGIIETKPKAPSFIGTAIIHALSSSFGVGNSHFRTGSDKPMEVDTVFGGCFKKETLTKIGLYNENLKSNEDLELNLRLKAADGKILLFPDIKATYFARTRLWEFAKNNFRNGFSTLYTLKHSRHYTIRYRHLVPMIFVASLITTSLLGFFLQPGFFLLLLLILVSYAAANLYCSVRIAKKNGAWLFFTLPFIFTLLHLTHGLGSLSGLFNIIFSKQFWALRFKKTSPVKTAAAK